MKTFKKLLTEATEMNDKFLALRKELAAYARTAKGYARIKSFDPNAARKLNWYVGDISPSRLVAIATKLAALEAK